MHERPDLSVVVLATRSEEVDRVRGQVDAQGVSAEIVVVDRTEEGALGGQVHDPYPSVDRARRRGAEAATGAAVLWLDPDARLLPGALSGLLGALTGDAVTGDVVFGEAGAPAAWLTATLFRTSVARELGGLAFWPNALELRQRLEADDRITRADVLVARVTSTDEERAFRDRRLLSGGRHDGDARISVVLATYRRRELLMACLESFVRQTVPVGTQEILVTSDGSPDDTAEWIAELELPVRLVFQEQANAGASAARNRALPHIRGEYTLWVNDDTLATADLLERHLELHARLDDPKAMVLGTFEQEPAAMRNLLTYVLEKTTSVFAYASFESGTVIEGQHFYTCNLSTPTGAVEACGGFDEDFPKAGGEDTEMGLRLEEAGYVLWYFAEARSWHRHSLTLDDLSRRQLFVADAFVRVFEKHPDLLLRWGNTLLIDDLGTTRALSKVAPDYPRVYRAAASLAEVDLAALSATGEGSARLGQELVERMQELLRTLNSVWWRMGYLEAFKPRGIKGFYALVSGLLHGPSAPDELAITVVIAAHGRPRELGALLDGLERQDLPLERFEVIVVDDGTVPPLAPRQDRPYALTLLRQDNAGPGAARNRGVEAARGRWILFLNDDAVPAPGLVRRHLELQQVPHARPTAVMGSFFLRPHLRDTGFREHVDASNLLFPQPLMTSGKRYPARTLCTGNLSIPRLLLKGAGGFDAFFRYPGGEDSELGFRLGRRFDMHVLYDELAACNHDHAVGIEGYVRRQLVLGWSTWHMANKHQDPSLITGQDGPVDERFWATLRARSATEEADATRAYALLLRSERAEEDGENALVRYDQQPELIRTAGRLAFTRGMQVARAGFFPEDYRDGLAFRVEEDR